MSVPQHHLDTTSRTYHAWTEMKRRCRDKPEWAGRGIIVCARWVNSYPNFLADMGECPGKGWSIDREDNDGNYAPSNCRWTTVKQQANNRRSSHLLTVDGRTQTIQQWCDERGIADTTFHNRLRRGWSAYDAVMKPVDKRFS